MFTKTVVKPESPSNKPYNLIRTDLSGIKKTNVEEENAYKSYRIFVNTLVVVYFQSKEEYKCQDSIQSSTTPDPGHNMGK